MTQDDYRRERRSLLRGNRKRRRNVDRALGFARASGRLVQWIGWSAAQADKHRAAQRNMVDLRRMYYSYRA